MSSQEKKETPETSETPEELIKEYFTFTHLREPKTYQLMHNDIDDDGVCKFQIWGKFEGSRIKYKGKKRFLLEKVTLRLEHTFEETSKNLFEIHKVEIKKNPKLKMIDFTIDLNETTSKEKAKKEYPHEQLIVLKKQELIDYHIQGDKFTRNGRPCRTKVHF